VDKLRLRNRIDGPSYKRCDAAVRERHEARSRSFKGLQDCISENESRTVLRSPEVALQEYATRRTWFEDLEDEVEKELVSRSQLVLLVGCFATDLGAVVHLS